MLDIYSLQYCKALTDIYCAGTSEQWGYIAKMTGWDEDIENYTVYCSDTDIAG